jgi:hypothetical protein
LRRKKKGEEVCDQTRKMKRRKKNGRCADESQILHCTVPSSSFLSCSDPYCDFDSWTFETRIFWEEGFYFLIVFYILQKIWTDRQGI